jgi:hypothetical protein
MEMADAAFVTHAGLDILTGRIKGTGTEPLYMGWGTGGATAANSTDTGLVTAAAETRATSTSSQQTTTQTNDTYRSQCTIVSLSGQTISEVALFNHTSTGTCFLRGTFTGKALDAGDGIQFTIDTKFVST